RRGRPDGSPRLLVRGGGSHARRPPVDDPHTRVPSACRAKTHDGRGPMSDLLERSIRHFPAPPSLTLDRVARRRDRRRRNRRIVSAVIALLVAVAVTTTLARAFKTSRRTIPAGIELPNLVWSKVTANDATFGGSYMSGVVAGGPGFVAVGGTSRGISAPAPPTSGSGYVWVS